MVKAGKVARLTKEDFDAERKRIVEVCYQCHSPNFADENIKNADKMMKDVADVKELAKEMRAAHGAPVVPEKAAAPAAKTKK